MLIAESTKPKRRQNSAPPHFPLPTTHQTSLSKSSTSSGTMQENRATITKSFWHLNSGSSPPTAAYITPPTPLDYYLHQPTFHVIRPPITPTLICTPRPGGEVRIMPIPIHQLSVRKAKVPQQLSSVHRFGRVLASQLHSRVPRLCKSITWQLHETIGRCSTVFVASGDGFPAGWKSP